MSPRALEVTEENREIVNSMYYKSVPTGVLPVGAMVYIQLAD